MAMCRPSRWPCSAWASPRCSAAKPCRERELVLAMVAARIVAPHTKLATTRWWHTTTLAEDFGVADADEDDLYAAMDWLLERQDAIQKKLAARHLSAGGLVLYDLSSSYFEGSCCPLAKLGYSRDGKKGMLQVNYGLLTDARGCPVAVSVHEGNVADSQTLLPEVQRLREDFGIEQLVMVGDRGMISSKAIEELRETEGIGWITRAEERLDPRAGRAGPSAAGLVRRAQPARAQLAGLPRRAAGGVPQSGAGQAARAQARGTARGHRGQPGQDQGPRGRGQARRAADEIGLRVGKVINQYKVAKHFELAIGDNTFTFARKHDAIAAEAALDGIYIIRTSVERGADGRGRLRAQLQVAGQRRARVPLAQDDRPEGAPDPPPHRRSGARAHLPVHARLLRRVAHARGLARADVRRHRPAAKATRDPVAPATALQGGAGQGGPPHAGRRHAGAQLLAP